MTTNTFKIIKRKKFEQKLTNDWLLVSSVE